MKKNFFMLLMMIVLVLIFTLAVSAQENAPIATYEISNSSSDNVTAHLYESIDSEGMYTLVISGEGNMLDWNLESHAPWWNYREKITSVVVEEGITEIGGYTFREFEALKEVSIANTVKVIGEASFSYCNSLKRVVLPDSVIELQSYAFHRCYNLESIKMSENITDINNYVFNECTSLKSISLPEKTTHLGENAFNSCTALEEIYFNASSMENYSDNNMIFAYAGQNGSGIRVTIGKNVTKIPNAIFDPYDSLARAPKITSVIFEDGSICKTIGDSAFAYTHINRVEIAESVVSIGKYAFYECSSLKVAVVPSSVTTTGRGVFGDCENVTVYCEASSKPSSWHDWWEDEGEVIWNYKNLINKVFTFKGYSTSEDESSFVVSYFVNYDIIDDYEKLIEKDLEFGVVFTSFSLLDGKNPLNSQTGKPISIEGGAVLKTPLNKESYSNYDFIIRDLTDEYYEHQFVIAPYTYNGESVTYTSEITTSATVNSGISYNEIIAKNKENQNE